MRFLGEEPEAWDDEPAFQYELRFATELDDDTVTRLAQAWLEHCHGSVVGAGNWLFSNEFAYLTAFPKGDHREVFAHVATFVRAVHAHIAPLLEAVHLTATEDYTDLDPGPPIPPSQRRPDPRRYAAPSRRTAFDAVLRDHDDAERRARYAKLVQPPKAGKLGLALCDKVAAIDVARTVGARASTPHPNGKWIANHARHGPTHAVVLRDTEGGDPREVWAVDAMEQVRGLAWLTGDHLAVLTSKRVVVLDVPATGAATVVASTRANANLMVACQGGRLLWLSNARFLAWNGSKLSAAGTFKLTKLYFVNELGERIVLRHGGNPRRPTDRDQYFEVTGLRDVLAKAAGAKTRPKRK
jgi:hypothetical protein